MKIAILGAGAMGCLYAAFLSEKNDITLFDIDKNQVDAINAKGVTVQEGTEDISYPNVKAALNGGDIGCCDLVIVFVKGMYTHDVMDANRGLIGPDTLLLTLQNGAGNDSDIMEYAKEENILIGTSKHNSVNLGGGKVYHSGAGTTNVGSACGRMDKANIVGDLFKDSGIDTAVYEDIQRIIWAKLFVNLTVNSVTSLLNVPIGFLGSDKYAWGIAEKLIDEAVAVAAADGQVFDKTEVMTSLKELCITLDTGRASMCQDRNAKRKTEIDRINGTVVKHGKKYGIATPYNELLVEFIHAMEGTYTL